MTQSALTAQGCDLHTHSIFSDGTATPTQIVTEAGRLGLIVALTDHNTAAGLPEFMTAAQALGVTAVPGIEFSTEYEKTELHLLGLFVLPEHYAAVEQMAQKLHALKERTNRMLVERLNQAGYLLDYDVIARRSPGGNINRAHVASQLLEQGYVRSIQEAFDTLLGTNCGFYEPPAQLPLLETIRELRQLGVLPVLAHPLQELTPAQLRQLLPLAKEAGLLGIETVHASYSPEAMRLAGELADEFGLLPSGGSDFHGTVKPEITLGTGCGWHRVPTGVYTALQRAQSTLQR